MKESSAALKEKYSRMVFYANNMEAQKDAALQELRDIKASTKKDQAAARALCEAVINKAKGDADEPAYFKMSFSEIIALAREKLDEYVTEMTEVLTKVAGYNQERTAKINELEKELEAVKKECEAKVREMEAQSKEDLKASTDYMQIYIRKLEKALTFGKVSQEELAKLRNDTRASFKNRLDFDAAGSVEFISEKSDHLDKVITEAAAAQIENEESFISPDEGPAVEVDEETKNEVMDSLGKASTEKTKKLSAYAKRLSDTKKLVIRIMGEKGYCENQDIVEAGREYMENPPAQKTIYSAITDISTETLVKDPFEQYVEKKAISLPGNPNSKLVSLTESGKEMFRYLYGKEPVRSEQEIMVAEHDNLYHGYGIKKTAKMLMEKPQFRKKNIEFIYLTRTKDYAVKVTGRSTYIPDIIICTHNPKGEARTYIEYETGKSPEKDMYAKCNKMAKALSSINIITPDTTAYENTKKKVEEWHELVKADSEDPNAKKIYVRIGVYTDIRDKEREDGKLCWGLNTSYYVIVPDAPENFETTEGGEEE